MLQPGIMHNLNLIIKKHQINPNIKRALTTAILQNWCCHKRQEKAKEMFQVKGDWRDMAVKCTVAGSYTVREIMLLMLCG